MKDIDFDELDRAVASALSTPSTSAGPERSFERDSYESRTRSDTPTTSSSDESTDNGSSPTANIGASVSRESVSESISSHSAHLQMTAQQSPGRRTIVRRRDVAERESEQVTPPVSQPSTEAPVAQAVQEKEIENKKRIIPHRAGRAMDVIASGGKPVRPVSRVATSVAPMASPSSSDKGTVVTDIVAPAPHPSSPFDLALEHMSMDDIEQEDAAGLSLPQSSTEDMSSSEPTADNTPDEYETERAEPDDDSLAKELEQPLGQEPAVSPFILDAKVTKRPLGGVEPIMMTPPAEATVPETTSAIGLDVPDNIYNEPATPAELDQDIIAVESQAIDTSRSEDQPEKSVAPRRTQAVDTVRTGPTAISRQYKEAPRVASEHDESGAIFDPQTYHTTVEHPKKQSSGWGWVIAIFSIIVLAMVFAVLAWMEGILPVPL